MNDRKEWYVRMSDGNVYGPADVAALVSWAEDGRVDPSSSLSKDRIKWTPAQLMPELEMKWLVEIEPGKPLGPYNRKFLIASCADGSLPATAKVYRLHEFPVDQDPPPVVVEKIVEKRVEVPVEKIVEKRVEVPFEKIVEKIVEVPVEKIVEKIVEVEKPPRTTVVVPEVVEPSGNEPPRRAGGAGLFGDVSRSGLAALEQAARRELAAAGKNRFGFFGRKKA
jgi:hypothetical protein